MSQKQNAQSLFQFFDNLEAGDPAEAEKCTMHYGCACMVQKGKLATQMLMEVQRALGVEPAAAPAPAAPAGPDPRVAELAEQLVEQRRLAADRDAQLAKANADNERLRDHIRMLQRQLNRLHDRRELNSVLGRLSDEKPAEPAPPADEARPEPEPTPQPPQPAPRRAPGSLAEALESEGAAPLRAEDRVRPDAAPESPSDQT